jgi:hypothetical protein
VDGTGYNQSETESTWDGKDDGKTHPSDVKALHDNITIPFHRLTIRAQLCGPERHIACRLRQDSNLLSEKSSSELRAP